MKQKKNLTNKIVLLKKVLNNSSSLDKINYKVLSEWLTKFNIVCFLYYLKIFQKCRLQIVK